MTTLLWLRDDLRTHDHEALTAAVEGGADVVALWIREEPAEAEDGGRLGPRPLGAAVRWWYHRSLEDLSVRLETLGIPLVFAAGDARQVVPAIAAALNAHTVRWSRRYAPRSRALDAEVKSLLGEAGIAAHSHAGPLLTEPWTVTTGAGGNYRVFTPYHRAAAQIPVGAPLPVPKPLGGPSDGLRERLTRLHDDGSLASLTDLALLDTSPAWWEDTVAEHWTPGESAALDELDAIETGVGGYTETRDVPGDRESTSRLSPRLRSGELSPRQVLAAAHAADVPDEDRAAFVRQLYWRDFAWSLTYHHPDLDWVPLRTEYRAFPYAPDSDARRAWEQGRTGIRLVDAGMRQLWQTGWMHNRVRMAAASLSVKNLLQPWQDGEAWFWDTLVDADEANNPVSWQWVAGCGADASPYFRIFNPDTQAKKFDPEGTYVARWVPEADAPLSGYPEPIVDLRESRAEALAALDVMKEQAAAQGLG